MIPSHKTNQRVLSAEGLSEVGELTRAPSVAGAGPAIAGAAPGLKVGIFNP